MDSFTINMKNQTQAQKAQAMLAKRGIRSRIEHTHHPRTGCSFALRVFGREREVCALLRSVGIPCDIS